MKKVKFYIFKLFRIKSNCLPFAVFLDVLTQYILHDKITFLDNVSLSNLVSYYCYIGKPKKAEECIFHLSFTTTDPHHSVSVCKENGLISGLIYSLCEGFHDFTSSITIVQQLMLKTSSENYKNWGYQLLLYLKFSLSGLKFPRKTAYLPESAIRIRSQILNYLFTPYISNASEQYTHLLFWLRFDAAAFLSAISCALDSRYWEYDTISDVSNTDLSVRKKNSLDQPSFIGENPNAFFDIFSQVSRMSAFVSSGVSTVIGGINQQSVLTVNSYNSSAANENPKLLDNPIITEKADLIQSPLSNSPASVPNPQEIVDLLSSLLLHSEQVDQRVVFLDFISVYLASGVVSAPSSVIDEVFQLLFMGTWTMTESITRRNRTKILRQERILSLMAKYPPVNDIERQKLLTLANSAGFYKISEKIYAFYKDYLSMFRIYVRNPEIHEPLEFFMRVMNLGNVDKGTIQKLKHEFIKSLESLLSIDRDLTIGTLAKYFTTDVLVDEILSKLLDETLQFRFFSLVFESLEREKSSKITSLQSAYYERYIELLCINEPDKVYHHLTISSDYDIHRMLSLCQRFSISDACAYLLERTGDLHGALSMMLMNFDNALEEVFSKTIESFDYPFAYHNFFNLDKIRKHLHVASDLCERCSIRNDSENENLWNIVLKHVIMKQLSNRQNSMERNLHPNMFAAINQFWIQASQFVIDRMRHYIRIEGILKCIFETGSHLRSSEFRCVVEDMLSGFAADKSIFTTAVKIFSLDLHNSSHELSRLLSKPFDCSLGQLSCAKCRKMLIEKSAVPSSTSIPSIHVFDCQHAFHRACLQIGSEDCPLCFVSQKRIGSTKSAYGKVRRIHSDLSRVKAKSFIQSKSIAIKPSMSTFEAYLSLKNGST